MLSADSHLPLQFRRIGAKIHNSAALIHIDAGSHIGIRIPEQLFV